MLKDTTVVRFRQPDAIDDPLTELAREGARRMLAQALIAEADAFVALWKFKITGWSRPRRASRPWAASRDPDRRRACRASSTCGGPEVRIAWQGSFDRCHRMRAERR